MAQLCSDNPCRSTAYLPVKGPGFGRHTSGLGSRFSPTAATLHFARSLDRHTVILGQIVAGDAFLLISILGTIF